MCHRLLLLLLLLLLLHLWRGCCCKRLGFRSITHLALLPTLGVTISTLRTVPVVRTIYRWLRHWFSHWYALYWLLLSNCSLKRLFALLLLLLLSVLLLLLILVCCICWRGADRESDGEDLACMHPWRHFNLDRTVR
jgi:hypothetical protein